jgi:hypothetical protein
VPGPDPSPHPDPAAVLSAPNGPREQAALDAVVAVASGAGLDTRRAGIFRAGSAVIVGLPEAMVLGRVDPPAREATARRQVIVSELLADLGVAAVTVSEPYDQPVMTEAGSVTTWTWLEVVEGEEVDPRELGRIARSLHDVTRGGVANVPSFDILGAVRAELDRAEEAGRTAEADLVLLRERAARLEATWPDPEDDPLGVAVVHGDLHRHNVLSTPTGPVLVDLEMSGVGPVCADIVPQVVAVRRYGAPPRVLDEFLAGYGLEASGWPGFETLVQAYELWTTAWAVGNRGQSAEIDDEAEVRLDRWRPGHRFPRPWALR